MSRVTTVLGDVDSTALGVTMTHEHLSLALSPEQTVSDTDALLEELADLARYGCRTVVELSNTGMGGNVRRLPELARATLTGGRFAGGINIIAATGFYTQAWHPAWVANWSQEALAARMVNEIERGIDGTDIRAGIIGEIGTSKGVITPDEAKVMRAAAQAHLQTGKPLSTHTSLGTLPLEQLDLLEAEGVDLRYVAIGHLDLAENFDTVLEVARRGAFVAFDTFGKQAYQPDEERIRRTLRLVEAGFGASLLVSVDISRNGYMKRYGGYGYDHALRVVAPELRRRGLDDAALHRILVDNPRRFLEGHAHD